VNQNAGAGNKWAKSLQKGWAKILLSRYSLAALVLNSCAEACLAVLNRAGAGY
jgi:hypothetical protein